MSLCVCGHPSADHLQFEGGEMCQFLSCYCQWYRKAADSIESTAILSAGGSPEGLAPETIAESVNVVTPPADEARADYLPMPECDHAQDCICVEPDHAYCCGTARAAVLDSMTDEARAGEPRTVLLDHLRKFPALETSMRLIEKQLDAIEREAALPRTYIDRIHDAKDRLLAEAAAAPTLDVERLAEAIHRYGGACIARYGRTNCSGSDHMLMAEPIAAEYARLSEKAP